MVASTQAQKEYIRELISEAGSLAEIDAIEKSLREGTFKFPDYLMLDGGDLSRGVDVGANDAVVAMDVGEH